MKKCPTCGTQSESRFCPDCGSDLSAVPETVVCPNCGTESTTNFCPECGQSLTTPDHAGSASAVAEAISVTDSPQSSELSDGMVSDSDRSIPGNSTNVDPSSTDSKKTNKSKKKLFAIIGGVLLLLIIIVAAAGGSSEDESSSDPTESDTYYEEETTTTTTTTEPTTEAPKEEFTKEEDYDDVSYDNLARNPDDYEGDLVKGSGSVIQVMDGENEVDLRIATNSNGYDDVVLVFYDPSLVDSRILEDDNVTYYGRSKGLYTYESTMGGEITVPLIQIHKISRN